VRDLPRSGEMSGPVEFGAMATTEDRRGLDATQEWRREVYDPKRERSALFTTISGLPNEPLYSPDNVAVDYERDLGWPGVYPYTRGVYPSMYRGRLWTMRQFAGFGTAEETNVRFRYLLEHGQTGLSTAFDMPTLMGYDSDHPKSLGEVGREGVAVDSLEDMERLFAGIPLGEVSTSMTINAPAAMLLAFYICVAEEQGVPRDRLRGTIQTDILKEYIAQKEWIFPPEPSMRLCVDMIEFCAREVPLWHPVSISGYHIREAGSTAAQELAFTLADGFAYVEAATARGLDVDEFAPRLSFFFNAHIDFFEEIAKYRAARRIWAREMQERYGARNPRSWLMRFHAQTAGVSLTAQQPENNIVRTAIEALAAVLGGCQSLHTNSFDEALALPTEHAVKIALRTQQVIAHETGVANTIDPLGGSYYLEDLTNRLEAEANDYFDRIRKLGGVVAAIKDNFFQREIAEASFRFQREVEAGRRVIVGVNRYDDPGERELEILKIDHELEQKQIERVQGLRARRDSALVEDALARLRRDAASTDSNLMPAIIEASKAYVTMGEMCDALREVWGVWRETPVF
jgi:methylmalonyl-CoA mutase, N-terminal domain